MIRKTSRGYEVVSRKKKRCLGIYNTREEAREREKQVQEFWEGVKKKK